MDWFFDSHRRPLEKKLSRYFGTSILAGNSDLIVDYNMQKFEVKSRVPTLKGIKQLRRYLQDIKSDTLLIVVSPVMIILCHFLFPNREKIIYNFSGLGFLRSKSKIFRSLILRSILSYPIKGLRVIVVQNSDDFKYFKFLTKGKSHFSVELIAGSGFEHSVKSFQRCHSSKITLGYVGRIRKDKGILDLIRAVSRINRNNDILDLVIWGALDDKSRHGFNQDELKELQIHNKYFQGVSADKNKIFNSFNWFCLPSNGEGLSKAAIEASSYGLPLLLSNVEGNRDMINGNGFLFEYGNINNLCDVLKAISILSDEEKNIMSIKSREIFEANWTMDIVYKKWMEIIRKYDTISA